MQSIFHQLVFAVLWKYCSDILIVSIEQTTKVFIIMFFLCTMQFFSSPSENTSSRCPSENVWIKDDDWENKSEGRLRPRKVLESGLLIPFHHSKWAAQLEHISDARRITKQLGKMFEFCCRYHELFMISNHSVIITILYSYSYTFFLFFFLQHNNSGFGRSDFLFCLCRAYAFQFKWFPLTFFVY